MEKIEILKLLDRAQFSKKFIRHMDSHFPNSYQKRFHQPYHQNISDNPLLQIGAKEALYESIAQLFDLQSFYLQKRIPLKYFYQSIYDLNYRLTRFYDEQGRYGLTRKDMKWLAPLYRGEIFDLGSLRFQITEFSFKEIERESYQYMPLPQEWKERFPKGTPILMIHISDDTDFSPEKIDASFQTARSFFKQFFPSHNYEIFLCRTWLLYKPTRDLLSPTSNIVSFAKRFQIIASNQNTKQALDRIYGTSDLENIKKMDKVSSLERTAYKNLDQLGVATGIIYK